MINSCESTKKINSFEFVAIPSPRDIFRKYGCRESNDGLYTCCPGSDSVPAIVSSGSVIDQMINAETMLSHTVK